MKKSITVILLTALLTGILSGCGKQATEGKNITEDRAVAVQNEGEQDKGGKTEITYNTWGDEEAYITAVVDAFNAQSETTHVTATFIPSTGVEYNEKIVSMLSGGSQMDLFSASNVKDLVKYRDAGSLYDMSELIKNSDLDIERYGTSFMDTAKDGALYGLPYRYSTMALFYNKRIFEEEGLPYPDKMTWDEYARLAKKLTRTREDGTIQWGGFLPDWLGEPILTVQRGSSVMDPDTSAIREWLALLGRLYMEDKSHMSFEEMKSTSTDWLKIFLAGDVAMLPNGEWTIGNAQQEVKSNPDLVGDFEMGVTYMPLPQGVEEPVTVGGPNTFIMINQNSDKKENAFEFASFLCGPNGAPYLVEGGMIPAYLDDTVIELYKKTVNVDGVEKMLETDTHYESDPVNEFSEVDTIWREEKELYLIGEQTLDETMKMFEERRAEISGK